MFPTFLLAELEYTRCSVKKVSLSAAQNCSHPKDCVREGVQEKSLCYLPCHDVAEYEFLGSVQAEDSTLLYLGHLKGLNPLPWPLTFKTRFQHGNSEDVRGKFYPQATPPSPPGLLQRFQSSQGKG